MKIAIVGYGKMGQKIAQLAPKRGIEVVATIDPHVSDATHKSLTAEAVKEADICIEFSHPMSVYNNIEKLGALNKSMVIGTTGWYQQLDKVEEIIKRADVGALYGENFSIGVELFSKIVEEAAKLMNARNEYDIAIHEEHHNQKVDAPSATALSLATLLVKNIERKKKITFAQPKKEDLLVTSLRMGSLPGTHVVQMDSLCDTITLTHTARSRDGFAWGALQAAEWLYGKKGFYHLREML